MSGTYRMAAAAGRGLRPVVTAPDDWSAELAPRLFAPPARWGWQAAAPVPVQATTPPLPPPRPAWTEPPPAGHQRAGRGPVQGGYQGGLAARARSDRCGRVHRLPAGHRAAGRPARRLGPRGVPGGAARGHRAAGAERDPRSRRRPVRQPQLRTALPHDARHRTTAPPAGAAAMGAGSAAACRRGRAGGRGGCQRSSVVSGVPGVGAHPGGCVRR